MENLIITFLKLCYGTDYHVVSVLYYDFERLPTFSMDEGGIPSTFYCHPKNTTGYKFKNEILLYEKDGVLIIHEKLTKKINDWFLGISEESLSNIIYNWFYSCRSCGLDHVSSYVL
jgi:hypothetical protein